MNIKSAVRTISAGAIVLGCVKAGPALRSAVAQPVPCAGTACDLVVTVTGTPPGPVVITANDVKMERRKRGVVITWQLPGSSNFEFRPGSIKAHVGAPVNGKPTTTQAEWDSQCQFLSTNGRNYKVRNKNDVAATLAYDLTVYHKATGAAFTLDPVIFNDP